MPPPRKDADLARALGRFAFTLAEVFSPHSKVQRCVAFTKPSRGMSVSERRTIINRNRAFCFDCERCRLMRGAVDSRKAAFTLAEVLITLGIIGVVAAITMPTLIQNYKEKQTVVALKKFYSQLEQAVRLNLVENPDDYSGMNIIKHFKNLKVCNGNDNSCSLMTYKSLRGTSYSNWGINDFYLSNYTYAQFLDGAIVRFASNSNCNMVKGESEALKHVCGEVSVDINGNKAPNTLGIDVFYFSVTSYGVIPAGTKEYTNFDLSFSSCNKNNGGHGCAAWVIYNENMDYLRCPDKLGWEKAKSCN